MGAGPWVAWGRSLPASGDLWERQMGALGAGAAARAGEAFGGGTLGRTRTDLGRQRRASYARGRRRNADVT